jgi:hypothetical protein
MAVLVEEPPRLLLLLTLAIAVNAQTKQEVDEEHREAAADRHREPVYAETARVDSDHDESGEDHHDADSIAHGEHPE